MDITVEYAEYAELRKKQKGEKSVSVSYGEVRCQVSGARSQLDVKSFAFQCKDVLK